ncbi:MAG: sialidase family protein [Micromonosporaceae bacterium]
MIILVTGGIVGVASPAQAQEPVTVPTTPGETVTVTWEGTVLPGANPSSECGQPTDVGADSHEIDLVVPDGTYDQVTVLATATVSYDGPNDLIVTIIRPDGSSVSGDSGFVDADESVSLSNPEAGRYQIVACMFAGATPQPYTGTLTLEAKELPAPAPESCAAPGKPLRFAPPSYVDTHRAGGEPSVQTHPDGTLLYAAHAGTTHFFAPEAGDPDSSAFLENYRGQVYAWSSDDGGATWNFVDRTLPPDGVAGSGFSDPDFAIDTAGNVYLTEINLVNVAASKSTDSGHSYELQNFFAQTLTDRQWTSAGPENVLFIVGNASQGGTVPTDPVGNNGHTIYRSTDGGSTFSEGVDDDGGLGDIKFDDRAGTLYEAHLSGGTLQMAAFRNALSPDVQAALTPELNPIADGVDMLSHWPAIDVDARGNVYIAWDEGGDGARAAGIWYSSSTDGGRSWAAPVRVDPDDRTDIWPWIAVGSPGRVAVSWFGNDSELPDHDAEQSGPDDPWNVYVAQTLTGLGCRESTSAGFRVTQATPEPFHVGTVCQGGTICQAQLVDRRLGDYFTIDIDTTGAVVMAYSDTRQGGAVALPAFGKQTGGPSFLRGRPIGVPRKG